MENESHRRQLIADGPIRIEDGMLATLGLLVVAAVVRLRALCTLFHKQSVRRREKQSIVGLILTWVRLVTAVMRLQRIQKVR